MRFDFTVNATQDGILLKTLLKQHGISKNLLAKIKFDGGDLWVNGVKQNAIYSVSEGEVISIHIPAETATVTLKQQEMPLTIVYEDDHFLVLDKPAGVASVTGVNYPDSTMSNYVAG